MIDGNTIKFGYGDLVVEKSRFGISIQQVKIPGNCGERVYPEDVRFCGPWVKIGLTKETYDEFISLLDYVEHDNLREFRFGGWIFDFNNYNADSVKTCRENAIYQGVSLSSDQLCISLFAC